MRIIITAEEALDMGIWEEVADLVGYNYYAMKEGMDPNTEIYLSREQSKILGIKI